MDDNGAQPAEAEQKPFRTEIVRGEPYQVAGRTLIPEARVVTFTRARGTIGAKQVGGWAVGLVHVAPTAVIEQTPDGERRIEVTGGTSQALQGIFAAGLATVVFFTLVRVLARVLRRGSCCR